MAEPLNLVAKLKIETVDASEIGKAISSEISKASSVSKGTVSKAAETGAKEKKEDKIDFTTLVSAVISGDVIAGLILDLLKALVSGFEGAMKTWSLLLEMLGRMVAPFTNLLIPLMVPFIYLSSMVARILSLILMPLYKAMMGFFSPKGPEDAAKGIATVLAGVTAGPLAVPFLLANFAWSDYISKLDWGDYIEKILEWSAWLSPLKWADFLIKMFWGDWLTKLGWSHRIEKILSWTDWLNPLKWTEWLLKLDWKDWITKVLAWADWINPLKWLDWLTSLNWKDWIEKTLAWAEWLNPLSWFNFIPKLDWKDFISWLGGGTGGTAHTDFLMRPGGGAVSFSPQDTIIGVKDASKLGGGRSVQITNNWYIQGYSEQSIVEKIKTTIEQHDANLSRAGYYQQGR